MTAPLKVVLTDGALPGESAAEQELFAAAGLKVEFARHECRDARELERLCAGADGVVVSFAPITAAVIDAIPTCRIVAYMATGFDSIDLPYATAQGIVVTNAGPYCSNEVADHTMALLLVLSRRITGLHRSVLDGHWSLASCGVPGALRRETLGIIGLGRIGSRVALRARAFGLRVIASDPFVDRSAMELLGVEKVELEQLVAEADYVSLHCTLTDATRGLVDRALLAAMKPTAFLVNTARGECVDTDALVEALAEGRLSGAALDAVSPEPLPGDHPLLTLPTAVVTPHAAFHSARSVAALRAAPFVAVADALAGREPPFIVNRGVLQQENCRIGVRR